MKDLPARFTAPLDVPRAPGARLIEAFSPKLERRVQFFDHRSFEQWVCLEADPSVLALCERPTRVGPNAADRVVDFWVRRADSQELILVASTAADHGPARVGALPMRRVTPADLAAAGTWIDNWQRMLPVVNASRRLLPKHLFKSILTRVHETVTVARVEHELSTGDPAIVRAAIFELLRTGSLLAPSLHVDMLSIHTLLHPAS
jgi:hypothetical protein